MTEPRIDVWIGGEPRPAGSKSPHVVRDRKTGAIRFYAASGKRPGGAMIRGGRVYGAPVIATKDSSGSKGSTWRNVVSRTVQRYIAVQGIAPFTKDAPVRTWYVFHMPRPQSHYRQVGGKPAGIKDRFASARPTTRPDALKLARAVEDALTGVLWPDDSSTVEMRATKVYATNHLVGVRVLAWPLDDAPDLFTEDTT